MRIQRDYVLRYLKDKQEKDGGYFGTDIFDLAKEIKISFYGLRKQLLKWTKEDKAFSSLIYLGKHRSPLTHDEILKIKERINSNSLEVKSHILSDLQDARKSKNEKAISISTFYRWTKQIVLNDWFKIKNIKIPQRYSVEEARDSLSTIFTFHGLKTHGGADLPAIYERFAKAKEWFSIYGIDPICYYPHILTRRKHLRSLLTSIPPGQQEEVQKRLIFEIQGAFIVECTDYLIAELIHRRGRIQQSMNASRQKRENSLRRKALESIRNSMKDMVFTSSHDMEKIHSFSDPTVDEEIMARMELMKRHAKSYDLISHILEKLINGMKEGVEFHCDEGVVLRQSV